MQKIQNLKIIPNKAILITAITVLHTIIMAESGLKAIKEVLNKREKSYL